MRYKITPVGLRKNFRGRQRARGVLLARAKGELASQQDRDDRELQEEVEKITKLAMDLNASLQRSQKKLDTYRVEIELTLQELAAQREQISIMERELGIERKGA